MQVRSLGMLVTAAQPLQALTALQKHETVPMHGEAGMNELATQTTTV